jgi:hypothetical protein
MAVYRLCIVLVIVVLRLSGYRAFPFALPAPRRHRADERGRRAPAGRAFGGLRAYQATIYLFVDQLALRVDKLLTLHKHAQQRQIPLVIVGAERDADWNTYCGALEDLEPVEKRVGNLSVDETGLLLDLLEKHSCLGLLKEKNHEERVEAFMGRADRQLLVALHELTQGKSFEEIVFSEHQNVNPEQARQLYLDIATMHQFGVNTAG